VAVKEPSKHSQGGGRFQPRIGVRVSFRLKHWGEFSLEETLPSLEIIRLFTVAIRGVCCCRPDKMAVDTDR